jgi:dihydroxyacetone kinase
VFVIKVAGAAAEAGASIDAVASIAARANEMTRSMGVALAPCELPGSGRPSFVVDEGFMEVGLGIHGEPGGSSQPIVSADELAQLLLNQILLDRPPAIDQVALLVNGLGATTLMELYILHRAAVAHLRDQGIAVAYSLVGEYVTSLDMTGASITLMDIDRELLQLLRAPSTAIVGFRQ